MSDIKVLEKWLKIVNHKNKIKCNYFVGSLLFSLSDNIKDQKEPLYFRFKEAFGNLESFPPETIAAGIGMYIIISCLSYKTYGEIINEDSIFNICLLYMDLDYIIDSSKNPEQYISIVSDFIYDDLKNKGNLREYTGNDRRFIWYRQIIKKNKKLIGKIYDLLLSEIKSYYIQKKSPIVSKKILRSITREKSKYTALLICEILEIEDKEIIQNVIDLGYISQILDDMFDIDEDARDGIQTMVSYDLKKKGNIDKIFLELLSEIGKIHNNNNEVRITMLYFALYNVTKYKLLSPMLMLRIEPYILFDYRYGVSIKLYN